MAMPHWIKLLGADYSSNEPSIRLPLPLPDELLKIYWDALSGMYSASDGRAVWQLQTREVLDHQIEPGRYGRYIRATAPYPAGIDPQTGYRRPDVIVDLQLMKGVTPFVQLEALTWQESYQTNQGPVDLLVARLRFRDNLAFRDYWSERLTCQSLLLTEDNAAAVMGLPSPIGPTPVRRFELQEGQWNHPDCVY